MEEGHGRESSSGHDTQETEKALVQRARVNIIPRVCPQGPTSCSHALPTYNFTHYQFKLRIHQMNEYTVITIIIINPLTEYTGYVIDIII